MDWSSLRDVARRLAVPAPMVKAGLFFLAADGPAVVSVLARRGVCQVERGPTRLKDYLQPAFPADFREVYRRLRARYEWLAQRWRLSGAAPLGRAAATVPTVASMRRLAGALEALARQVEAVAERRKELDAQRVEQEHLSEYVQALADLGLDLQALTELRFLHLRFGMVPSANLDRLKTSAQLGDDVVLLELGTRHDRTHIMVLGIGGVTADLEGLLAKAHFESLAPPGSESTSDTPTVQKELAEKVAGIAAGLADAEAQEARLRRRHATLVLKAAQVVARATVFAECDGVMEGRAPVAFLSGWIALEQLDGLEAALRRDVPNPVALVHEPASPDESPPSAVTVPWIFRPAVSLIALFGTPGYDEINPALVLAVTTPLIFGMMFGDAGYGLLLLLVAVAARRRLGEWTPVAISCSVATLGFGLLYGSVFGVEHWLPALWLRPIEEPFRLLTVALWGGVGFIVMTFILKATTLLRQGRRREALLGLQGGAGAAVYVGAVLWVRAFYLEQGLPAAAAGLLLGGGAVASLDAALEIREHGRARLADLASEYFHLLLSLLTNTLSFLRLAAFALSHAALSAALFLVIETIPATPVGWAGRLVVLVVGSVVILVLHTLVVGIQTIRLEFYEGLTRYYRGDGRPYRPLRFPAMTAPEV